ncbi:hypothetical protein [Massilia aquatica]|uniref:RHS repeat-associated core domain-containing protein n=1 Tax=Massilia aquatica TaxID=2609000 RepID=A0ABX0MJM8_9BURK|nr:hypothetical protein [Massilia aquatica]NHZ45055.1 hypothetical protein [Massilia aquatica]
MSMHHRSFDLVDEKGGRDLFALPDSAHNIARSVGQMGANGDRIAIAYNQRQLTERVEDSAGRGYLPTLEDQQDYPRLRSIAMRPAEPDSDTELLLAYEYDASSNLGRVSNGKGTGIF